MVDIRQSRNYAKYMESLGWIVENGVFIRRLPIISFLSLIKVQRSNKINLPEIEKIAKKYHAFMIKLEPDIDTEYTILNTGYRRDSWPLLPTKTLVLDLRKIDLLKDTKYEIRKAVSNNLTIEQSNDINLFYKLLQETMKIGHWEIPIKKEVAALWKAFLPRNSQILLAKMTQFPQIPLGGCLLIWGGDTAHYMYAANTARGRELGAAYFTLWETIKFCQKKGLKYLDLEGIYDERYKGSTKNWQGFTKFKMGWGGKVKEYPGSWTKFSLY